MKIVKCSENQCTFEINATDEFFLEKIKVDGDLVRDNTTERCDYAVKATTNNGALKHSVFLIELKGRHLEKAIKQLESTIEKIPSLHSGFASKNAHAVCAKIIPAASSSAQVAATKFLSKYKFKLRWHSIKGITTLNYQKNN